MCQSRPCEHPCVRTYRCLYLRVSVHLCLGRRRMEHRGQFLFHELPSPLSIPTGENQPERGCQGLWESRGVGGELRRGKGSQPAWRGHRDALPGGAAPGSSRQPIWSRSCREVGAGEGAAPHRPAINHGYGARGQGVGRGQGAAAAAHTRDRAERPGSGVAVNRHLNASKPRLIRAQ